jgi:hypothetical protein
LTLSQSIEKLQHFKISFDGKHQRDYWQFWYVPSLSW